MVGVERLNHLELLDVRRNRLSKLADVDPIKFLPTLACLLLEVCVRVRVCVCVSVSLRVCVCGISL